MYLSSKNKSSRGFTLIELLVVIAIIGMLASGVMVLTSAAKVKAKDAKIKAEIHGIQLALEDYAIGNGGYPNPPHDPGVSKSWCIGANDCFVAGTPITDNIKSWNADLFPDYNSNVEYWDAASPPNLNKGYVYVSCKSNGPFCPENPTNPDDIAYIIYPKSDSVKSLQVGTFTEQTCSLNPQCQTIGGGSDLCGPFDDVDCEQYSNLDTGACNYDPDGTGEITAMCICGPDAPGSYYGTENCNSYCRNVYVGACNFDPNGDGVCLTGNECGFCNDNTACNYLEEGECDYLTCQTTCIDPDACNHGAAGNCDYSCWTIGCMDENACNYDVNAHTDDGSCEYESCQTTCNEPLACNYQQLGACEYISCGFCSNPIACNYLAAGQCDYSCLTTCTDPGACNNGQYGVCDYSCYGTCEDVNACNYGANGACEYDSCNVGGGGEGNVLGCTDGGFPACNYNPNANVDDGSCDYTCYL